MRSDIVPGGIFPDYELPDHTGKSCKLSVLPGDDPLILTLARPLLPKRAPAAFGTRSVLSLAFPRVEQACQCWELTGEDGKLCH